MNIELIVKLAKLANNNPNDNEANAAARKVCKLIAEGEYKFSIPIPKPTYQNSPPKWTSPPTSPLASDFYDVFQRAGFDFNKAKFYEGSWDKAKNEPNNKRYDRNQKRPLVCTKCGNSIETGFVGPPQVYVCTSCQWKGI